MSDVRFRLHCIQLLPAVCVCVRVRVCAEITLYQGVTMCV